MSQQPEKIDATNFGAAIDRTPEFVVENALVSVRRKTTKQADANMPVVPVAIKIGPEKVLFADMWSPAIGTDANGNPVLLTPEEMQAAFPPGSTVIGTFHVSHEKQAIINGKPAFTAAGEPLMNRRCDPVEISEIEKPDVVVIKIPGIDKIRGSLARATKAPVNLPK